MKNYSEYSSVEEVVVALIAEGIFPRNKKVRVAFPGIGARRQRDHVARLKDAILTRMQRAQESLVPDMSRAQIYHAVRGDNYPQDFNSAIDQLLTEGKITVNELWSKASRPTRQYHLAEF